MKNKYFGTDGIRGEVGLFPIVPDFLLKLGFAVGLLLNDASKASGKKKVLIARDTRISGFLLESSIQSGLIYAGCDVYLANILPTPALSYLVNYLHFDAGIMISASHNPYNDNGVKIFFAKGCKLNLELEQKIESLLLEEMQIANHLGAIEKIEDVQKKYIDFCINSTTDNVAKNNLLGIKIVLDCANGANYIIAKEIFTKLGANVIEIASNPNGININYECGATNLKLIIEKTIEYKAQFGIAFDGDGDRVIMVDSSGKVYDGDKLIYIIFRYYREILNKNITSVIGTFMSNYALEMAIKKHSADYIRVNIGDKFITSKMEETGCMLGAEQSGHIICGDKHNTGDGIIASLQVIFASINMQKSLNEIVDWVEYPQIMMNVDLADLEGDIDVIINTINQMNTNSSFYSEINNNNNYVEQCDYINNNHASQAGSQSNNRQNSQSLQKNHSNNNENKYFILARKSGTENKLRIMIQASNKNLCENVSIQISEILKR